MTSQVKQYMDQLWTLGRRCYDDLEPPEVLKLTGFIMKEASVSRRAEFIIETKWFDEVALTLASMMIIEGILTNKIQMIERSQIHSELAIKLMSAAGTYAAPAIDRLFETYTQGVQNNEQEQSD